MTFLPFEPRSSIWSNDGTQRNSHSGSVITIHTKEFFGDMYDSISLYKNVIFCSGFHEGNLKVIIYQNKRNNLRIPAGRSWRWSVLEELHQELPGTNSVGGQSGAWTHTATLLSFSWFILCLLQTFPSFLAIYEGFFKGFFYHIRKSDCKLVCLKIFGNYIFWNTFHRVPSELFASPKWQLTILNGKNCKNNLSENERAFPKVANNVSEKKYY